MDGSCQPVLKGKGRMAGRNWLKLAKKKKEPKLITSDIAAKPGNGKYFHCDGRLEMSGMEFLPPRFDIYPILPYFPWLRPGSPSWSGGRGVS